MCFFFCFVFFFISVANKSFWKTWCMSVWLEHQNKSLLRRLLKIWYLYSFSENCIIHQLEKINFEIIICIFFNSVFFSMYGFSQASWLNLITVWSFSNTNPWLNTCFKVLLCMTYSFSSFKLAVFQLLFFQTKIVNHCKYHVIF